MFATAMNANEGTMTSCPWPTPRASKRKMQTGRAGADGDGVRAPEVIGSKRRFKGREFRAQGSGAVCAAPRDGIDFRLGDVGRGKRNARGHRDSGKLPANRRQRHGLLDEQAVKRTDARTRAMVIGRGSVAVWVLMPVRLCRNSGPSAR